MYTINLSNGVQLDNLELNGNNYISETILSDSVFEGGLDTVTVSDEDGNTETFTDVVLVKNQVFNDKSWFILGQKTAEQREKETMLQEISDLKEALRAILDGDTGEVTEDA